jgi:hypothetical protein
VGDVVLNPCPSLTELYKESVVRVQWRDGTMSGFRTLYDMVNDSRHQLKTANKIVFAEIKMKMELLVHKEFLRRSLTQYKIWDRLQGIDIPLMYDLYMAVGYFSQWKTANNLRTSIRAKTIKMLSFDFFGKGVLRMTYDDRIRLRGVRDIIHDLCSILPYNKDIVRFWENRVRIIYTRLTKIMHILSNHNRHARDHVTGADWGCGCERLPAALKDDTGCVNAKGDMVAAYWVGVVRC